MARKSLAVCLVGCRITVLFIEDVQQPSNVCLDQCFQISVQSMGAAVGRKLNRNIHLKLR